MASLPQPIHVALLSLVFAVTAFVITLAQRLGDWRSKAVARILGVVSALLIICVAYLAWLWVFSVNLPLLMGVPRPLWWGVGGTSVVAIALAWFTKRAKRSQREDLSCPAALPDTIQIPWTAKVRSLPPPATIATYPVAPAPPLLGSECYAKWYETDDFSDHLSLSVWNGTPHSSQFKISIAYMKRWSGDQLQYVDTGLHYGLYSFQVFDSRVTPDELGTRRLIGLSQYGFKIQSIYTDRFLMESKHGEWKLGLSLNLEGRYRQQELCFHYGPSGLSPSVCFQDGIYPIAPNYLDEIDAMQPEPMEEPSVPPSPESTKHEN